ncbi:MAG: hypothetical protein SFY81_07000, partial [Verrucomicrobiota bacterium]|nr:hypothetical protein [Verrucomicrobiota bacterium]
GGWRCLNQAGGHRTSCRGGEINGDLFQGRGSHSASQTAVVVLTTNIQVFLSGMRVAGLVGAVN